MVTTVGVTLTAVLEAIARKIFTGKKYIELPGGKQLAVERTVSSRLRYVGFSHEDGMYYKVFEQNPNTGSDGAKLAKAGHLVLQVARATKPSEFAGHIGLLVDGKWKPVVDTLAIPALNRDVSVPDQPDPDDIKGENNMPAAGEFKDESKVVGESN